MNEAINEAINEGTNEAINETTNTESVVGGNASFEVRGRHDTRNTF